MRVQHQQEDRVFRLDQSDGLLRKIMESAAVGMVLIGPDDRFMWTNRAFDAMLGHQPGDWSGKSADDMVFEDDQQAVRLRVAQMMRGEIEDFSIDCRLCHSDGTPLWVLGTASVVRNDATGEPLYSIVQMVNIDKQKRAEAALAASESRWNFALESAGQGVWDHDIRTDDIYYSSMWRKMRGIPAGEYVNPAQSDWLTRLHPDDVPRALAHSTKQGLGEDGYDTLEYRERHRDGHYMWILSRGKAVEWDSEGNAVRTVGTDTDITRLKLAEAHLAEEKERLRVTLDSIGDGVISTDSDGRVQFMNPVAEALTGWAEADAMERPIGEVFVAKFEATGEPADDIVVECLRAAAPRHTESDLILASRHGTGCGVSGIASPVRTEDGRTIGAVLVFKDVTDDQEVQRKLAHSANHDMLTGLPNRSSFGLALTEACRQAGDEQRAHALCFIDLDRFKPVNDTAGHAAGDALLQKVAQIIRGCCRINDFAARLGGDEFVVLLADCSMVNARLVAQKIVDAIARIDFAWNGAHYVIGASIGIAPVLPDAERDVLAMADAACYGAKAQGRGRVVATGD
ncbi:MAG: diguanylate cyclase [Devosia sp.]